MARYRTRRQKSAPSKAQTLATQRFYFLIVLLVLTLVFAVGALVLWLVTPRPADPSAPAEAQGGLFSVKTIVVEGNTRYYEEAVIGESGVAVGQSIFNVDSQDIEAHLLATFPYFASVEVQTLHMDEVKITVTETPVIGVVYANERWVPVGANGKALDEQEVTSDRPKGMLYIKGALPPEGGVVVGQQAIEDYTFSVLQEMLDAIANYELTNIIEIDLTDLSDITMNWRDQITVKLGNTSNLTHEIGMVASTIPKILESRGEQITGILNLSSYSNDSLENQAVFTPSSLLPTTTKAPRREVDENGTTAADEDTTASDTTQADDEE